MLIVTRISGKGEASSPDQVWHVGEPVPTFAGRIFMLQADGHELEILIDAIRNASKTVS